MLTKAPPIVDALIKMMINLVTVYYVHSLENIISTQILLITIYAHPNPPITIPKILNYYYIIEHKLYVQWSDPPSTRPKQ